MIEDVPPQKVWTALAKDRAAVLCDVRTEPEWLYVGVPDLGAVGKRALLIPWQLHPDMAINPDFLAALEDADLKRETPIYFLCRSGVRSRAAAEAARAAGFTHVFNVADGFEGPADSEGHRGRIGGWKASGLPWRQR